MRNPNETIQLDHTLHPMIESLSATERKLLGGIESSTVRVELRDGEGDAWRAWGYGPEMTGDVMMVLSSLMSRGLVEQRLTVWEEDCQSEDAGRTVIWHKLTTKGYAVFTEMRRLWFYNMKRNEYLKAARKDRHPALTALYMAKQRKSLMEASISNPALTERELESLLEMIDETTKIIESLAPLEHSLLRHMRWDDLSCCFMDKQLRLTRILAMEIAEHFEHGAGVDDGSTWSPYSHNLSSLWLAEWEQGAYT